MLTKVVAGVITDNNKVCIFKRGSQSFRGLYEFPGGKVEKNESDRHALYRELKEELNIEATIGEKVCHTENDEISLSAFMVTDYQGDIYLNEHMDMIKVDQGDIKSYTMVDIDQQIVEALFLEQSIVFNTLLGHIKVVGNYINLTEISFTKEAEKDSDRQLLIEAKKQIQEYLLQERKTFSLPLYIKGSAFYKEILHKVRQIGYGQTKYYSQLHKGSQAVGNALGKNRHVIVIPCHRVTGKHNIGGYSGGIDKKKILLNIEGQ